MRRTLAAGAVYRRGDEGTILHGRSQEPFASGYGGLLAGHTVVVRRRADGLNAVTHIDPPLFRGVQRGTNDQGIGYSEETYSRHRVASAFLVPPAHRQDAADARAS